MEGNENVGMVLMLTDVFKGVISNYFWTSFSGNIHKRRILDFFNRNAFFRDPFIVSQQS